MTYKFHCLWYIMIAVTLLFLVLFTWFTLYPGQPSKDTYTYFSKKDVVRARDHARIQRIISVADIAVNLVFLIWFTMGKKGRELSAWCERTTGRYTASIILYFIILWALLNLIDLPFSFYEGYTLQKSWGFSTQTLNSWWSDYIKNASMDLVMSCIGVLLLFFAMNRWPDRWHIAAWATVSVVMVLETIIGPVLVEPMFNKFEPTKDPKLISMVQELADKADIPVDEVLIMDASRRTRKANAYFTGIGKVKRIVVYDTLLKDYPEDAVKGVIAHEMAHWKKGHIIKGLAAGCAGIFILFAVLHMLIKSDIPFRGRFKPYVWAYITLFLFLASYISGPIYNYASRYMETEADLTSVSLTHDPAAAIKLQTDLTAKNVSDMSPPAFIEWFSYSHPSGMHRIESIKNLMPPA